MHLGKDQAAANSPADQDAMSADSIFGSDASSWPSEQNKKENERSKRKADHLKRLQSAMEHEGEVRWSLEGSPCLALQQTALKQAISFGDGLAHKEKVEQVRKRLQLL